MRKKIVILFIAVASSLFIYAATYKQDIPPGIDASRWIKISGNFGIYIDNSPIVVGPPQRQSYDKTVKGIDMNSIRGTFMVKKDGEWHSVDNMPFVPQFIPAK